MGHDLQTSHGVGPSVGVVVGDELGGDVDVVDVVVVAERVASVEESPPSFITAVASVELLEPPPTSTLTWVEAVEVDSSSEALVVADVVVVSTGLEGLGLCQGRPIGEGGGAVVVAATVAVPPSPPVSSPPESSGRLSAGGAVVDDVVSVDMPGLPLHLLGLNLHQKFRIQLSSRRCRSIRRLGGELDPLILLPLVAELWLS